MFWKVEFKLTGDSRRQLPRVAIIGESPSIRTDEQARRKFDAAYPQSIILKAKLCRGEVIT